jgi:DNA-directed RNA polymerase subunit RPC12/RpoP
MEKENIYINCPYCNSLIEICQINCGIFRHGIYKDTFIQIPPHSLKEDIDKMNIYGCGKPFKIIKDDNNIYKAIECDYI